MKSKFAATKKLITVILLALSFTANATTYYISASGNDANNGTSTTTSWKTLSKLNSMFSSLKAGDNVLLNRGDVFYGNIIVKKSGTSGLPITIGAYGTGAKPIISGFTTVSAWTNLGSNIWESTSAVSALKYTNMVVVKGVNTPMGRYPNTGYFVWQSRSGNTSITSSSLNSAVTNWTGAEVAFFTTTYRISRDKITAQSGGTLTYTAPSSPDLFQAASTYFVQNFLIQNDPRTLDAQNEWYYNPSTKKLRIYSTASPTSVQIATVDTMVLISGYNYITFSNISFQGSNSSTVELRNSQFVTITTCDFNFSGIDGVSSPYNVGSSSLDIDNCTFNHINNNGIEIGKSDKVTIKLNTVTNIGMIPGMKGSGSGMTGSGTAEGIISSSTNTLISYNTLDSIGYTAIYFAGNNAVVDHNYVKDFCIGEGIKDGGGIYTWNDGTAHSGMKVSNNIVLNSGIVSNGIYIDSKSNGMEVSGNSVSNCQRGIYLSNSWTTNILNNTTYGNTQAELMLSQTDNTITMNNLVVKNNIFLARKNNEFAGWFATMIAPYLTKPYTADSNYYARPVSDSLSMQTNFNGVYTWQTLNTFKAVNGTDVHSKKSPKTITDTNDLKFVYNETTSNMTISLPYNYIDVKNVSYNGTITLAPYTSAALIKNGAATANKSPVAKAGTDQSITLPTSSVSLSGSGTDADGTISAYAWSKISGSPTAGTITAATSAATTVTGLVQGTYQFQLKVTDNAGATGLDTVKVTVNASGSNSISAPTANAGADQSITLPASTVSLSGSGTEAGGSISTFKWAKASGPASGTITNAAAAATSVTGLAQGVYQFQLTVTDNKGSTAFDNIQITVNAASTLLPAVNPANTVIGMDYKYYEATSYTVIPGFSSLTPVKTGSTTNFYVGLANRTTEFSLNFTGFISVPTDGQYTFYTNSDDGSNLYIDNVLVVNNDGLHGATEKSGIIGLKAGLHALSVGYFNQTGTGLLTVSYAGPGIAKQVFPASSLYRISTASLLAAVNPANTVIGMDYKYYEASAGYSAVPVFSSLTPVKTGSTTNFYVGLANRTTMFSLNFTGFVSVPSDGQYTFYINSDDGSNLYIDNVLVVNNDGLHGPTEKSGTIGLKAGKHALSVGYFNQTGAGVLTVSYAGPGISKQVFPASSLYRISTTGSLVAFDNNNISPAITSLTQVGIKAYPNPFTNYIEVNINSAAAGEYKLMLVDVSGKVIWTKSGITNAGIFQQSVNTSALERGVYFLRVIQNNTSSVIKLVK